MTSDEREALLETATRQIGENGWGVVPGFLALDRARGLAREALRLRARGGFRPACVGRGSSLKLRPDVRSDWVHWMDPAAPSARQRAWLDAMEALRLRLNSTLLLGLFDFECHYAIYPPGAAYAPHLDRFADAARRTVSCVLYLNEGWTAAEGGELRIHPKGDVPGCDVLPEAGTLALMLSADTLHEVLPTRRERISIAGWLRTRA